MGGARRALAHARAQGGAPTLTSPAGLRARADCPDWAALQQHGLDIFVPFNGSCGMETLVDIGSAALLMALAGIIFHLALSMPV